MSNLFKIDKVGDIYIQQGELSKRNETTIEQFSRELELEYIEMLVLSAIVASYQRDNHQSFRSLIKLGLLHVEHAYNSLSLEKDF